MEGFSADFSDDHLINDILTNTAVELEFESDLDVIDEKMLTNFLDQKSKPLKAEENGR